MIMRVYRCIVVAGKEAELTEFVFAKAHPWLRAQPGLVAFYAGRSPDSGNGRCMVQIWESLAAIQSAFGEGWRNPRKLPDEVISFIESESVEHYEVADAFNSEL